MRETLQMWQANPHISCIKAYLNPPISSARWQRMNGRSTEYPLYFLSELIINYFPPSADDQTKNAA